MTTTQLVTFIKDRFAQDWSRANILDLLNTIQHILCDHECEQMLFTCDNSDFPVPYLKTTSGTIEYEITDANLSNAITWKGYSTTCRQIKDIFIKTDYSTNLGYRQRYRREPFQYNTSGLLDAQPFSSTMFERVPARHIAQSGLQSAKVIFPEDPGTYIDRYFIEFWVNPIELSSPNIPLSLNVSQFFDVLLDGVVGMIEQSEHGRSERWDRFMEVGTKKFWSNKNKGNENYPLQIQRVEC